MATNLTMTSAGYSTSGKFGQSLNAGYGGVATPGLLPTNNTWTIKCWVKSANYNTTRVFLAQSYVFWAGQDGNNRLIVRYGVGGTEVSINTTVQLGTEVWIEVEISMHPTDGVKVFADGVLAGSSATTPAAAGVVPANGGFDVRSFRSASTTFDFLGEVDEISIWNSVLHTAGFTPPTAAFTGSESGLLNLWHLNGTGTDSAGASAATSVQVTGPTSGVVGVASGNFTASADGTISGTIVVTPSDGGGGGSFSPSTVSISAGSPAATFTYTSASTGAKTLSFTNNGGLSNPSNITYTATSAAATAISFSGSPPSTGPVGVASSNFTVQANGSISGTVTVTPNDSSGGGVFTPTSVSLNSGTLTASFTYTPGSTGAKSINLTNSGGLTNPSSVTYTATASGVKPPNDSGIVYSPYTWLVSSGQARTINPGAYFRTFFTGSSCTLSFDLSNLITPLPRIRIRVDGRTLQEANLAATIAVTMPSGQSNTKHLLEVDIVAITNSGNAWSGTQTSVVKLTSITLNSPSETLTAPPLRPARSLFLGDSITEGVRALATTTTTDDVFFSDATQAWAYALGNLLGCEFGVVGFGAAGLNTGGSRGVPKLADSWPYLWAGQNRDFSAPPDICAWLYGTNDGSSDTRVNALAALNAQLAALPTTKFYIFRPLNGTAQAANLAEIAANCSDPKRVRYVDTAGFWNSADAVDALHPYGYIAVGRIAPLMQASVLGPDPVTTRVLTITLTASNGTTPRANLTGLKWAFFDQPQPQSWIKPIASGTGETTDANGVLTISVATTLVSGGVGWLVVTDSDGSVTQSPAGKGFSGPVLVV